MDKNKLIQMFRGKQKTENLIVLSILIIVVVVAINYIWNDKSPQKNKNNIPYNNDNMIGTNMVQQSTSNLQENDIEKKLENILSNISGAGKVKVMLTYSESSTTQPIYDENHKESNTVESDENGGTRSISETDSQKQIIYKQNADGSKEPITKSILSPKIEGAIITAQGANNADVKTNIIQAVEAATGLATHKIQVFEMEAK
ncbi:MAG: hypothetical protein IKG14_05110 [Clostridia bacterium]|nr:hypothetical protein [Clostridia bacterium]